MADAPSLMEHAIEVQRRERAMGVVVLAFYGGGVYTTAWAGQDGEALDAMHDFAERCEALIEPESPKDRGEVGLDPRPKATQETRNPER